MQNFQKNLSGKIYFEMSSSTWNFISLISSFKNNSILLDTSKKMTVCLSSLKNKEYSHFLSFVF